MKKEKSESQVTPPQNLPQTSEREGVYENLTDSLPTDFYP